MHTASLLNLRGSEFWVMDVSNLLRDRSFFVNVVNFDFARRYPKNQIEISRRIRVLGQAFGNGVSLTRLSAISLRLPLSGLWHGTRVEVLVDRYLHFLPLNWRFLGLLNDSDVVYFVVSQGSPVYLLVVLGMSAIAGWKPVIAGLHVTPKIKRPELALLKIAARIGLLRAIHVVNRSHEAELREIGCPLEYIPNGIDFGGFHSDVQLKAGQETFVVLFVGAMTQTKGADLLPEIYQNLRSMGIPFTLTICTSGGELENGTRAWSESKTGVAFRGFVERGELSEIYAASSVAIFPSKREAFPLACLEVQASGTPVVVPNVPGLIQAVTNHVTGVIVEKADARSFGEGIREIYSIWKTNREEYLTMCKRAQEFVKDNFQWSESVKKLDRLIRTKAG